MLDFIFRQAELIIDCRKAIQSSYKYLIYQLTCGGEEIPDFLNSWDRILENVNFILENVKVN